MITSCYDMVLDCDGVNCTAGKFERHPRLTEITGETFSGCAKVARDRGWKIFRATQQCLCPTCVKNKNQLKRVEDC